MPKQHVETTVEINAPAAKVWRVFVDPAVTRQMGGEYVTDWQVGSSFGFRGLDGTILTQGEILQVEPERLLQHKLFGPDGQTAISVITYTLWEQNGGTTLTGREEFSNPVSEQKYADAAAGWKAALALVKELAEKQ